MMRLTVGAPPHAMAALDQRVTLATGRNSLTPVRPGQQIVSNDLRICLAILLTVRSFFIIYFEKCLLFWFIFRLYAVCLFRLVL